VISANREFHEQVQRELARRYNHLCVTDASSFEGARRAIAARSPAVVGLETIATLAVRMRESPVERRLGNAVGTRLGRTGNPSQLS
jgi:hypothetical protein